MERIESSKEKGAVMSGILRALGVALTICTSWAAWGDTWYVDGSVSASGDGKTWETAFQTIQEGITAASHGDEVVVAQGIYVENVAFNGKNIVLRGTDPPDAAVVENTIIDGDQAGPVVTFSGSENETCVLSGFTIRNGSAPYGGGVLGGDWNNRTLTTIENNIISGNHADGDGGGIVHCDGAIQNNVITGNSAGNGGGLASCGGTIQSNTITRNSAEGNGGGLNNCGGTIQSNTITRNSAEGNGGGLNDCGGTTQNNIIAHNSATWSGGGLAHCSGTIRNNTITSNSAPRGGGLYECGAVIANSIIWGNLSPELPELYASSTPTYSCIRGWEGGGDGNISACPYFVDPSGGDYHLQSWSPCIDAGDPASDFSNEPLPNGGRINMGVYGNTPEAASASEDSDGDLLPDDWEKLFFPDLSQPAGDDPDGDGRSNLQEYQDGTNPTWSGTWYVDASAALSGDGSSWESAFKTIQEGIDAAWDGETVIVALGTYFENIRFKGKNIVLRSTDPLDPAIVAGTIVDGGENGSVVTFVGSETGICVLSGFTIRNGKAVADDPNNRGGGIRGGYVDHRTGAVIENNVITNNSAWDGGGLVYCGGIIRNNIISDNTAEDDGGGVHRCSGIVENNTIIGNSAGDHGGAIAKSTSIIRHNLICNNSAGDQGGALRDCDGTIESNTFADNVGVYGDTLALCDGVIRNCIIWGGTRHGVQLYHCNMPMYCYIDRWRRGGLGNVTFDPYFVDAANGDYHLQSWSPCIDAGDPLSPYSEEPEPNGGRVNMGFYGNTSEAASKSPDTDGDALPDDWEVEVFGDLSQTGSDDADGDELSNIEEYRKGLDPTVMLPRAVWYVRASVAASGDGTSQATPFKTIREAIEAASDRDTVIVSPGIYFENVKFNGKNIVLHSTNPEDPAVVASTIIDGNQLDSVVAFLGSEDETCALAGFTIRNGSAVSGGGICGGTDDGGTHATIRNNDIVGNSAPGYWDEDRDRWVGGNGGAIAFCDGVISDNIISVNSSRYDGGGLYVCDATIHNNTVIHNAAGNDGGGMDDCDGTIQNNLITDNSAQEDGGGLSGCDGAIQNNTILANSAGDDGGGLIGCLGMIRNCIVWGNVANGEGSQIWGSNAPFFCCIQDWAQGGEGNIFFDPRFADAASGDCHLEPDSPCIDRGQNFYWFAWPQRDLDGFCRLAGSKTDMGCYEWGATADRDGDLLSDSDEATLQTDLLLEDTDGDGLRDGLEVLRGANPVAPTPPSAVGVPGRFPKIQEALCLAVEGDEIIVSPGTYTGNLQFCGADVILSSSDPDNLDVVASTILDGGGMVPVVCFVGSESAECVLSGFTIQNGLADHGSGIRGGSSKRHTRATIRNNTITANYALRGGAGVAWCDGTIENNTISNNQSEERGGGLSHCHGTIQSNAITGNLADWQGGGMNRCNGIVRNNTIAANFGSGLYDCHGTIEENAISANFSSGLSFCGGRILSNMIVGNTYGVGLEDCDGTILNNLIVGNETHTRGGGLYLCDGTIQNNTIAMNSAGYAGGGLHTCYATISNCIIWGNIAGGANQVFLSSDPTYSCIQDWNKGGEGNITDNPLFVGAALDEGQWTAEPTFHDETSQTTLVDDGASWEPGALVRLPINPNVAQPVQFLIVSNSVTTITIWGDASQVVHAGDAYSLYDFRLSANSPCIDLGKNDDWMWRAVDLDHNARILPGPSSWMVDMGAYEFVAPTFKVFIRGAVGGFQLVWTSQPGESYTVRSSVDLSSGKWIEEATGLSGDVVTIWSDPDTAAARKFYKIELE